MNYRYIYCKSCEYRIGIVNEDGEITYIVNEEALSQTGYRCPQCNHDCMIYGRWFRV